MHLKKWLFGLICGCSSLSATYSATDYRGIALDQKLVQLLNFEGGIFVEAGANNGISQSNTKLLEESYGWTGILVEPSEILHQQLLRNRPHSQCFACALGSFEEEGSYVYGDFDGHLMSSIGGDRLDRPAKQKVLIRSLQSILNEEGLRHVNLLSLDTEGYELNVLKGIDFAQTTFDYMLIEVYEDQFDELTSFLNNKGYDLIDFFSNYNRFTNPGWDGTHNDYLFKRREAN